jgi:esterase/lipase superfamily enzyme
VGFVYAGLRPIWQVRFQADDLFVSRIAFALAPLPSGILIFALGISRPYLTFVKRESGVVRVLAFAGDWVFVGTVSICVLMYLVDPFTVTAAPRSKAIVTVYFVTDRQLISASSSSGELFSGDPSPNASIGYGMTEVPISWRPKDLNYNSTTFFEWDNHRPISVDVTQFSSANEFARKISIASGETPRHEAFVFIHGFDNSFDEALATTAKLAYDLKFDSDRTRGGVSILYSWPSAGNPTSYYNDYKNASGSVDHLAALLQQLRSPEVGFDHLQLIAHSMGTRVLGLAVQAMEEQAPGPAFENVTLAAADVDEETFDRFSPALKRASTRITLYVSTWDTALALI